MDQKLLAPINKSNPIVFFDINIGREYAGRMVIELRKDVVPKTAENFRCLCTGENGIGTMGRPLHYKGVCFHKIMRVYVVGSGDIINNDGSGGESIYGPLFDDENFELEHSEEGIVSMANYGKPNTNNSQFVITSTACENLNGTNVVVGRVLRGLGILGDMEQNTTDDGKPTKEIVIADCGEILEGQDWCINDNDESGDTLPPYPQDWIDKLKPLTTDELLQILLSIRSAGNHYFTKSQFNEARRKYRKANRYYNFFRKRFNWQESPQNSYKNEEFKELDNLSVLNNINMAAVDLKCQEYENAKYCCSEALSLDPACSKAYYRRGQANIALKNYEDAIDDLLKAHSLLPENKEVLNELNHAKRLLADYNRKQMLRFKHLFN
ncbi:peptidyl-prolyl cis-trans isomerase D [Glossina fuscipes]|uniref:peptidylprolyl isomerase n=1 Tax=Glossina fuscipes TaxID=7396 RepID=A0A8U0W2Q5_9MUSC|nr:peptidyl-prolyl cis-trans isomerase D [Glossina fuscipes]